MLIDSHAHIISLEDPPGAVRRASEAGIGKIISIGTGLDSSINTVELTKKYNGIYASIGIHPHTASSFTEEIMGGFEKLLDDPKVVGLGETGLDYHYMNSTKEEQMLSCEAHIYLAAKHSVPFIIHIRDADDDLIDLLKTKNLKENPGVIHCFSSNWNYAKKYIDLGFFISFSGILTFKRAEEIRDAAKKTPIDRILYETDSPYLAPVPKRGKDNEPCYVEYVAALLAEIRGLSLDELNDQILENVTTLFTKLPKDKTPLI
ncbi:MAG: TatD family hydrolase [Thermodesulfobacteriota bacterium]